MKSRVLRCYVRGRSDRWEAMCIDLDIVAQGCSRSDVATKLEEAVIAYIEMACAEPSETTRRLLQRKAPVLVRLKVQFGAFLHLFLRSRAGGDLRGGFEMACPA